MTLPPPISTVGEFLRCLEPMTRAAAPNSFLYRGQADSHWRVDCSAVRRLATNRADTLQGPVHPAVVSYLDSLLREASQHAGKWAGLPGGFSELQILAQLQHFGAATPLIDFTLNPFVALWFASNDRLDRDGAVYVLSRGDLREIDESHVRVNGVLSYFYPVDTWDVPPYVWFPNKLPGRAEHQQSAFVLGVTSQIAPYRLKKCIVAKGAKTELLRELRDDYGIREEDLFADLPGFAQANSVSRHLDDGQALQLWLYQVAVASTRKEKAIAHARLGLAHSAIRDSESAVKHYTKAIELDPGHPGSYHNRAKELTLLGDLAGALADYDTEIGLLEGRENDSPRVAEVYWLRGHVHWRLEQMERAVADMGTALKRGLKRYHSERVGGIVDYPPAHVEYQLLTRAETEDRGSAAADEGHR